MAPDPSATPGNGDGAPPSPELIQPPSPHPTHPTSDLKSPEPNLSRHVKVPGILQQFEEASEPRSTGSAPPQSLPAPPASLAPAATSSAPATPATATTTTTADTPAALSAGLASQALPTPPASPAPAATSSAPAGVAAAATTTTPATPATLASSEGATEEVELLDWGDSDSEEDPAEETSSEASAAKICSRPVLGVPVAAGPATNVVGVLPSGVDSVDPLHPVIGPDAAGVSSSRVPAVPSVLKPLPWLSPFRPTSVPTPSAAATGRHKMVWRRLKVTEDSTVWLPEQKAQGFKQLASSQPSSCWELGESSGANARLELPPSPRWQTGRMKYWWRKDETLQEDGSGKTRRAVQDAAPGHTMDDREFCKRRLVGRCFRCLGVDHQVAQCRDPVRCLRCKGFGHISRHCSSARRQPSSAKLRSQLTFPTSSIHSRLAFHHSALPTIPKRHHLRTLQTTQYTHHQRPGRQRTCLARLPTAQRWAVSPSFRGAAIARRQRHPGCIASVTRMTTSRDRDDATNDAVRGHHCVAIRWARVTAPLISRLFKELLTPSLPTPDSPPPRATLPRTRKPRKKKTLQATRSSLHLAAKPSAVPVAQRAQHKLMGELEFVNPQQPAPDAAVTGYIDLYGADLPEQAIKAIRAATRLVNKELAKALAAMVDEYDAAEMEAQ
ncbi:unnamed protein product [Miscanthus lutarioriparius]|uniref:CCHC-type domain-containing protein n=1 Tax=Miscanthus lutarioriparius TaxID=422564 RepID=A0A811NYE9_9POAL|nr:unnamed protein product [Miscanthus lutarioriparius]